MIPDPAYLTLYASGELDRRASALRERLGSCTLCPRECGVDRLSDRIGVCKTGLAVSVSSYGPHFGEEPPLVGSHGSGTIFFTNCNLWCLYCQNYDISHLKQGNRTSTLRLAKIMLHLQELGCHNINLVTPTHVVPHIVQSLCIAAGGGLHLPLVYNTSGYDSVDTLKILDNIVDVYMPDIKYSDNACARKFSGAGDYWKIVRPAILEMYRQVGDLRIDADGVARRGLLIRHLVLPNDIAGSAKVLEFIASEISLGSYVNIMNQYRPVFKASMFPDINRPVTPREYRDVLASARVCGLKRGFTCSALN